MAWRIEGTYFENCSCDAVCPCTWSALSRAATHDFCKFAMTYHVDSGDVEGVDVGGVSFAVIGQTPKMMSDGNWTVGVFVDDKASDEQADAIGKVVSGQLGGPMAMLAPLISNFVGVERAPIEIVEQDGTHSVKIGSSVDTELEEFRVPDFPEPTRLTGVMHPANTTLTVAPATRSQIAAFGIEFGAAGTSGFAAPVSWSG
jgi:hypothetical protein